MRSMFAYFTPTRADGTPFTKTERCLQALQGVAVIWLLIGVLPFGFESNLHISPDARHRLWIVQMICISISLTINSVLIPLRRILRDERQ